MNRPTIERQQAAARDLLASLKGRLGPLARQHAVPLGLPLIIGALLRLLWLGDTSFLGDQAQLLAVGRAAADHHAIIITGIPSSIGSLNPPVSTWLYAPFAVLGGPLGATVFTALANIAAIALLYVIAVRFFGRLAGFVAALIYATASGPVHYGRFIWQQNLLAPVVILLFWVILEAVARRWHGWLPWAALCWGAATQLHPTAAPLLGLIALGLLVAWRDLRTRDFIWTAVVLIILFGPTLLWEALSQGYDLAGVQRLSGGHAVIDTWTFTYLLRMIQPASSAAYGVASSYVAVGRGIAWLGVVMEALLMASQAWLVYMLVSPWLKRTGQGDRWRAGIAIARTDVRWRLALALALWEALPLSLMLRHTRPVEPHYLLVITPAIYLCLGAATNWVLDALRPWLASRVRPPLSARGLTLGALVVCVGVISVTQTVGVLAELSAVHRGTFDALALPLHYGTPLSSEQQALSVTQATAQRLHATVAIAATRTQQEPLGYLNATDASALPATDYISDGCVAVPSASASAPLVTLATPGAAAALMLPSITSTRLVSTVAVQGGQPYQVFATAPGATLPDERVITSSGAGAQAQPIGWEYTKLEGAPTLAIRWQITQRPTSQPARATAFWDGADPRLAPIGDYTFTAQALDGLGQAVGSPITATCARLGWTPNLSMITTMRLPAVLASGAQAVSWRLTARVAPPVAERPTLGPLTFETAAFVTEPTRPLMPPVTFTVS